MEKIIIANWKMHPATKEDAGALFSRITFASLSSIDVVVCPPLIYLSYIQELSSINSHVFLGAQDVFWYDPVGAYTGSVSASMLLSSGATYCIVGHSERRRDFLETDAIVGKKMRVALEAGLIPIVCIGESSSVRNQGLSETKAFIRKQLETIFSYYRPFPDRRICIAYEPLWAIGTALADDAYVTNEIADYIKGVLGGLAGVSPFLLYGGSVTSQTVSPFVSADQIDGVLVGGASLTDDFVRIIDAFSQA
jgi:triosephosphate isomerase